MLILRKKSINFVPPAWKLDNPYYHNTDNNEQFESNDISIVEYEDDDDNQSLCEFEYNQEQFMLQSPNYPRKYPNGNFSKYLLSFS